ncbi:MAG TPA: hypothetical protein EYP49_09150 [Anaerolineae bacterium]|nr:hypothetical protein [Anaerolineae bacterium]
MKPKGVLGVDDTLLTHYGRHFEGIAYLYDPVEKRYTRAHNLVNLHYSDDQRTIRFTHAGGVRRTAQAGTPPGCEIGRQAGLPQELTFRAFWCFSGQRGFEGPDLSGLAFVKVAEKA